MSTLATNAITDANGGNTASINGYTPTMSNMAGRNRIINGDMRINQRSFSGTPSGGAYLLDRYFYNANASRVTVSQSSDAPANFTNSISVTSSAASSIGVSDFTNLCQIVEGYNISDLSWGSASAKAITLSFWVKSSLTGTFGGGLRNKGTGGYYGYPFTYTISAANTWTYITVTVAGPTSISYTWDTNNTQGIYVWWDFGTGTTYTNTAGSWVNQNIVGASGTTKLVETNGATWKMTGVQLEEGSVATPFENVDYSEMLRRCQRYYWKSGLVSESIGATGYMLAGNAIWSQFCFPVTMRATPTVTVNGTWGVSNTGQPTIRASSQTNFMLQIVASATGIATTYPNTSDDYLAASIEL